jgi:hypothetical protein
VAAALVVAAGVWTGYDYELRKAPYVRDWKERFKAQAPLVLAGTMSEAERKDPSRTMLWDYDEVREGLLYMYRHGYWIFRRQQTLGLTDDGWLTFGNTATTVCPAGGKRLALTLSRGAGWPAAAVELRVGDRTSTVQVGAGPIVIDPLPDPAVVSLVADDEGLTRPVVTPPDERRLVAHVDQLACG